MRSRKLARLTSLALSVSLSPALSALAQGPAAATAPPTGLPTAAVAPVAPVVLDLNACRKIALEKQPSLTAARASLAAANAKAHGVEGLWLPGFLAPDLRHRRCQSQVGVRVAEATLLQTEWETIEAVTRMYWTAVLAHEQVQLIQDTQKHIEQRRELVRKRKDPTNRVVDQYGVFATILDARLATAVQGRLRALAALREAMGVGFEPCFELAHHELPHPSACIDKHVLVEMALARRPELTRVAGGAEVSALEIEAQCAIKRRPMAYTFAAGGDIHANPAQPTTLEPEYRPGAINPEMPVLLPGKRCDRVEQARALHGRADAVVEKIRGLVLLEAENAYLKCVEVLARWKKLEQAYADAAPIADFVEKDFLDNNTSVTPLEAIRARELVTQLRADANQARLDLLVVAASIERITAGGVCPLYDGPRPVFTPTPRTPEEGPPK